MRRRSGGSWLLRSPARSGWSVSSRWSLEDYCTTVARIRQGERAISREGMVVPGAMGGVVKNPWTTVLNQYRAHTFAR
jgi:hypothetical protein